MGLCMLHDALLQLFHSALKASHAQSLADPRMFLNIISAFAFSTDFLLHQYNHSLYFHTNTQL